ncbi:MAG: MerC mercury resistance protein [Sphingomonadales bacterium 63-6]|nr:MAG: MerC mercury resistance protein [Sphingomonadales bacterium 63-6]
MIKEDRAARASTVASKRGDWLDGFAVCASISCMIHCLGLPLLLAALPAFADQIDPGDNFHAIVLALAVPTSAIALVGGWRKHRAFIPLAVGSAGLVLMALGIVFASQEILETAITVSGGLLLAGAHIANWRHRRAMPVAPA